MQAVTRLATVHKYQVTSVKFELAVVKTLSGKDANKHTAGSGVPETKMVIRLSHSRPVIVVIGYAEVSTGSRFQAVPCSPAVKDQQEFSMKPLFCIIVNPHRCLHRGPFLLNSAEFSYIICYILMQLLQHVQNIFPTLIAVITKNKYKYK